MCNNTRQHFNRVIGEISQPFTVKNGVKQGYAFLLVIFNFTFEEITQSSPREKIMEVNEGYICLTYADDLVLLKDTIDDVTQTLVITIMNTSK